MLQLEIQSTKNIMQNEQFLRRTRIFGIVAVAPSSGQNINCH